MKPIVWRCLAASSFLIMFGAIAVASQAETRPQYGGTLRIAVHGAITSLDPADTTQPDSFARRNITLLIFETLVTMGNSAHAQPALASSWQSQANNTRWVFQIRRGVHFDDGSDLTAEAAAASLRTANPTWKVTGDGNSVIIECDAPSPELPAGLALPRNAIAKRNADKIVGTGPFHIVDWQPGKKLTFAAEENYWRGRAFLDGIEIEMGKSFRDQLAALELGRADLVEVPPEQAHRITQEGRSLLNSSPIELVALVFSRDAQSPEEKHLREALALSVDRASMRSVLLQGAGQASAGILPSWMSGYGFVFSTEADLTRARFARQQVSAVPNWTIGYDKDDALARLLAERVALNARDAGLSLQPTYATTADLRLVRIPLQSKDAWISLAGVAAIAGITVPKTYGLIDDLYAAEQQLLATQRIIPLFHLPAWYAASAALKNWNVGSEGNLHLADAWLESK